MRDTNLHNKDCSEMHSGSCSQMTSSCKWPISCIPSTTVICHFFLQCKGTLIKVVPKRIGQTKLVLREFLQDKVLLTKLSLNLMHTLMANSYQSLTFSQAS